MSKAVEIIDGVLFVHTRHYDDVNRVIICHQKKPYRVFSDDEKKEEQRPHGEWIVNNRYKRKGKKFLDCSECHYGEHGDIICEVNKIPRFCPNCGALMEG